MSGAGTTSALGALLAAPPFPTIAADPRLDIYSLGKGPLFLRRHGKEGRAGKPVLMLHGASASCDTFLAPPRESVFDYLVSKGLDVWLLDWRASFHVAEADATFANKNADVAAADLPDAIRFVHQVRQTEGTDGPISVAGHCMGAAIFAMAIGRGLITADLNVDKVLFATIGLFYQVTWDGWTKVMDRILERLSDTEKYEQLSPAKPWPEPFEEVYKIWPATWGPPWERKEKEEGKESFFHRLAFLYGQPFLVSNLHAAMDQAAIRRQFGAIPLELYRHAAQNALRGFAAKCDAEGNLKPSIDNEAIPSTLAADYLRPEFFAPFAITLLTGEQNPLWHRDSIDLMGEWLSRDPKIRSNLRKHVLDGYGHQDLWWGKHSKEDVFPKVLSAVR